MRDFLHVFEVMLRPGRTAPLRRLDGALASGRFDVDACPSRRLALFLLAVNAAIARRLPVVATFHSLLSPRKFPVADRGFRLLGCGKWRDRAVLTAVSTRVVEVRRNMVGEAPILILPNGTDASSPARPERRAGRDGTDAAGGAGRGPAFSSAQAADGAPFHHGDARRATCRLRLPAEHRRRRSAARRLQRGKSLGLEDRVRLVERSTGPASRLFAGADLFLVPSHLESFGIAALQARMAGVPVLSMASSGAWDFLTPGVDSLEALDDQGFADALAGFLKTPQVRERLQAGCATPPEGYDWGRLAARVIASTKRRWPTSRSLNSSWRAELAHGAAEAPSQNVLRDKRHSRHLQAPDGRQTPLRRRRLSD